MSEEAWALAGIIATLVAGVPAYLMVKKVWSNQQSQSIGTGGTGYQAGRDNNVGNQR